VRTRQWAWLKQRPRYTVSPVAGTSAARRATAGAIDIVAQ
jgi:hypothetical protein